MRRGQSPTRPPTEAQLAARFKKGDPRSREIAKRGGHTIRKLTRDVREFLQELVNDPEVQDSIRLQIMAGEKGTGAMAGYFTAVAHQVGKPKASVEVSVSPSLSKLLLLAREKREEPKSNAGEKA